MNQSPKNSNVTRRICIVSTTLFIILTILNSKITLGDAQSINVDINDPVSIEYYLDPNCDVCIEKLDWFNELKEKNPELNYTRHDIIISGSESNLSEFFEYTRSLGFADRYPPLAVFKKGDCIMNLHGSNFTRDNVMNSYNILVKLVGDCPDWERALGDVSELSLGVSFVSGMVTGLSPCVILITSFISSTMLVHEDKKKLLSTFIGFTLGVLLMYLFLTIALITAFESLTATFFSATIRYVFAGLMCLLGAWYILDAYNESSRLFKTPDKLKSYISATAKKGTFFSALFLGFVFSFMKIPCVGGIMSALIYNVADSPGTYTGHLILFYIGLMIPLIVLMYFLMKGLQKDKVDHLRKKYRPLIRYISGVLILALTLYAIWDLISFPPYYLLIPLIIIAIIPIYLEKNSKNKRKGENQKPFDSSESNKEE